jgi:hypothetical protein
MREKKEMNDCEMSSNLAILRAKELELLAGLRN